MVRGAFVGVLVPLCLASGGIENFSNRLLAGSMAGHNVEEFLGSLWSLMSQLMD